MLQPFLRRPVLLPASLSLLLGLVACSPEAPTPADDLPASLRVSARIDSTIAAPPTVDFSVVAPQGRGPSGTLIYSSPGPSPHGNYDAYTYDEQRRLIGTYSRTSFGYDEIFLLRYEGSLLAASYGSLVFPNKPDLNTYGGGLVQYRYDAQHRVALALTYLKQEGHLRLDATLQYEYDANGELQLTRRTAELIAGFNQTTLQYWKNGDVYREERYSPGYPPVIPGSHTLFNQVENPLARLHVWPQNPVNRHYQIGYGPSEHGPARETTEYRYYYDSQNRMIGYQRRLALEVYSDGVVHKWGDWSNRYEFTYAP